MRAVRHNAFFMGFDMDSRFFDRGRWQAWVVALALGWAFAGVSAQAADASAGIVTAMSGTVRILASDGRVVNGSRGASIYPGDILETARDGQADLRFTDDSVMSIRPHTRFRVDEYAYTGRGDGSDRSLFSLLQGSFRTVTGLIGKLKRSTYAVTTPTATIGIRGTEYTASVGKALNVSVQRGEITVTNSAGSYAVFEGQTATVSSADAAPQVRGTAARTTLGANEGVPARNISIQGTTRIEASQSGATAVGAGAGNTAANQAGVIGGR
jgi:hypothetical protein